MTNPTPHKQVPEALTYERDRAIMQGERNASPEAYSRAVLLARAVLHRWGQPAGREPMTPEQIGAMSRKYPAEDLCGWSYRMGIADAETHHGIKAKEAGNAE